MPAIFRKMFADDIQKLSAEFCLYVHAIGWIKPNYVFASVLAAILCELLVSCVLCRLIFRRAARRHHGL